MSVVREESVEAFIRPFLIKTARPRSAPVLLSHLRPPHLRSSANRLNNSTFYGEYQTRGRKRKCRILFRLGEPGFMVNTVLYVPRSADISR